MFAQAKYARIFVLLLAQNLRKHLSERGIALQFVYIGERSFGRLFTRCVRQQLDVAVFDIGRLFLMKCRPRL